MPFSFYPQHEHNCPDVSHCLHLGGVACVGGASQDHIRSSQSCGGHSKGAIDDSRRDRETSRSPPERHLSGAPANNDNRKEKV